MYWLESDPPVSDPAGVAGNGARRPKNSTAVRVGMKLFVMAADVYGWFVKFIGKNTLK